MIIIQVILELSPIKAYFLFILEKIPINKIYIFYRLLYFLCRFMDLMIWGFLDGLQDAKSIDYLDVSDYLSTLPCPKVILEH